MVIETWPRCDAVLELTFVLGTDCPNFGGLRTDSAATGTASHLGQVSMTTQHCTPAGQEITGGEMILVAANEDKLYIEYSVTADPLGRSHRQQFGEWRPA